MIVCFNPCKLNRICIQYGSFSTTFLLSISFLPILFSFYVSLNKLLVKFFCTVHFLPTNLTNNLWKCWIFLVPDIKFNFHYVSLSHRSTQKPCSDLLTWNFEFCQSLFWAHSSLEQFTLLIMSLSFWKRIDHLMMGLISKTMILLKSWASWTRKTLVFEQ